MIRIRARWPRVAVAVGAASTLAVTPVAAPAAYAAVPQPVGVTVGADGRLHLATTGAPTPATGIPFAPPGAGVTITPGPDGTIAVFAIGTHGGLVAARTSAASSGITVLQDGPTGLAPPGGHLDAITTTNGIHVFFTGNDGALHTVTYPRFVTPGAGPRPVTAAGLAPPGAAVAATRQPDNNPGAAFVGVDGALHTVWRTTGGAWATVPASPPQLAPAGGGVAATGLDTFFTGLDGALWYVRLTAGPLPDPWTAVAVAGAGTVPAGAHLAAGHFPTGPTVVLFAGHDGAIHATSNAGGTWRPPSATTAPGVARPGTPVAATITGDQLLADWCGNSMWFRLRIPKPRGPHPEPWNATTFPFPSLPTIRAGLNVSAALI
ncbi:hypothetical protein [Polymorphospora rubra]|uniref:hypothetical protein n=1 Tax=Polymorphospora rubra TaxID=338584 RepID=UPI003407446A